MKKAGSIVLLIVLTVFVLCGCSSGRENGFENTEWVIDTVQDIKDGGRIIACSAENKTVYDGAEITDLVCRADKNSVVIENITDSKTYTGTYSDIESSEKTVIYRINIDGKEGLASVSDTVFASGEKIKTLIIGFEDYSLKFFEKRK